MSPFLTLFTKSGSLQSLANLFGDVAHSLGFPSYAISRISRSRSRSLPQISVETICTRYPDNWVEHYVRQGYGLVDPVHRAAFTHAGPYRWGDISGLNDLELRVLGEASDAGLAHGFSIPVHEPDGTVLLFNFSGPSSHVHGQLNAQLACLTSALFHFELHRLGSIPDLAPTLHLSPRQRECLFWVARGKTSSEISTIMEISRHTVDYHITEAMKSLNVNSRTTAAVYATVYGLIRH